MSLRSLLAGALLALSPCCAAQADVTAQAPRTTLVRAFEIDGNTAVPSATLDRIAAEYAGRAITDADLQALLRRLSDVYVQSGYATSRARVPDQEVADGTIRIEIVEGYLEDIVVTGARGIDPAYLIERLRTGVGRPLNVAVLNANLHLLMQERGIGSLRGQLRQGTRDGGAILDVTVDEAARFDGGLRVANDRAPAVGGVRGAIEVSAYNLFGRGDVIDLVYGHASGLSDREFRLTTPLNARGTEFTFRWFDANSELIEEQFSVLGALTEAAGFEAGLSQALWRSPTRQAGASVRFVSRQIESYLLGQPFSFSPGVENGKADVKAVRLGLQWTERGPGRYLGARFTWSAGIGGLGATTHADGRPDSRFHTVLGQLQWQHTLGPRAGTVFARAEAQLAFDDLLPQEKFAVGGLNSVRGYRRARYVRDNGWSTTLEWRLPVAQWRLPGVSGGEGDGQLAFVLFADAGRAWNDDGRPEIDSTLVAAGPGLRWDIRRGVRAEAYWGGLRRQVAGDEGDLQDDGVHFQLTLRPF